MFKSNIVELVKDLRKETSVSQEELANYIWVSRLTYISVENWKRKLKDNEIAKIADFFEKPISDFLNKKEHIEDPKRKLKDLILYIALRYKDKPNFWKTILNKLLYFSDFNYYEWTWSLITGINYKKLPYWPVPENITEILDEMVRDWEIAIKEERLHNYNQQRIIVLKDDISNLNLFKETDKENKKERLNYKPYKDLPESKKIVDDVLDRFIDWKATDISELSHEDTPYKVVKKYGDIIKPVHVFYRSKPFIVNHHNL